MDFCKQIFTAENVICLEWNSPWASQSYPKTTCNCLCMLTRANESDRHAYTCKYTVLYSHLIWGMQLYSTKLTTCMYTSFTLQELTIWDNLHARNSWCQGNNGFLAQLGCLVLHWHWDCTGSLTQKIFLTQLMPSYRRELCVLGDHAIVDFMLLSKQLYN